MSTIYYSLSKRLDPKGYCEIQVRYNVGRIKEKSSPLSLRASSGLFINPDLFEYEVDFKKTPARNIPKGMTYCTEKRSVRDKGKEIVIKKPYGRIVESLGNLILPDDKVSDYEDTKKKLADLNTEITDKAKGFAKTDFSKSFTRKSDNVTCNWLEYTIDKFRFPNVYKEKPDTFYEMASNYIRDLKATDGFKKHMWVTVRAVARYEGFRRETKDKNFTFDINTVTLDDIQDFLNYLRNEYLLSKEYPEIFKRLLNDYPVSCQKGRTRKIEERGNNVLHSRMKRLRAMWKSFISKNLTQNNPFDGFKNVKEHYGKVTYITLDERNKIASTPMPTKHLEVQRDIFVAQCRIGCRVSDLIRLTESHIHDGFIEYVPKKTKDEGETPTVASVPITDGLNKLIEKYKGQDGKGRLFPCISPQRYNDAIKEIFTIAGITRKVEVRDSITGESVLRPLNEIASSHLARRTFVANLYNKVADPSLISKMSGHSEKSASFKRYREPKKDLLRKVAMMAD